MQYPKISKNWPSGHHRTTLSGYIFATNARIDNRTKNLLSSNISATCPHNMVNFGPLAAEIDWRVWGTPSHFNGYLGSVTARHSSIALQPNFAALNRGCHLYSAGRPSGWAFAHISSSIFFLLLSFPRLFSAVADWMSTILPRMMRP